MNSFDFITAFGHINEDIVHEAIEFTQAEKVHIPQKEGTKMSANTPQYRHKRMRRTFLLAAVITVLFAAMCAGAYALNLFGIRDAIMSDKIVSDRYEQGEYAGKMLDDGTAISYQGYIGSPEYEASREFNDFLSAYEANDDNGDELHQPLGEWGEAHRRVYGGIFTKTLVDKFLEISEKYGLTPWNELYDGWGYLHLCELIGSDGFLISEETQRSEGAYNMPFQLWDDGSFSYSDAWGAEYCPITINRRMKGSMSIDYLSLDKTHEYREWSYTTMRGEEVSIYSGENQFIVLYNGENAFISIRSQAGSTLSDEDIVAYIDSVDLGALDNVSRITLPEALPLPTPMPTP